MKDTIICGVVDRSLRERMLREPDIYLKKAIELGQAAEETKMHAKQSTEKFDSNVDKVTKAKKKETSCCYWYQLVLLKYSTKQEKPIRKSINNCKFCAGSDFYIGSVEVTHADPEVVSEKPVEKKINA